MTSKELPIFDRVIAQYPFLASMQDAKLFCQTLCRLSSVSSITPVEYYYVACVACGGQWGEQASGHAYPRYRGSKSPIAAARLASGMTQAQLATAVGCTQGAVSRWERGLCGPRPETIFKIAQTLGCTMEELLQCL